MCAAIAAPALAAGPPGWVVFGVAVLGSAVVAGIGYIGMSSSRSQSISESTTSTRERVCEECPRPWSVRTHAQGSDIGGTSGATLGAPPIVKTSPVTVAEGVALASVTYGLLTRSQMKNLADAYENCVSFISKRPPRGFLGSRSFYGFSRDNNRFDVDSFGTSPNFIS